LIFLGNHQDSEGNINIPEVLKDYLGREKIGIIK